MGNHHYREDPRRRLPSPEPVPRPRRQHPSRHCDGSEQAGCKRALRDVLATRTAPAGELVTAETRLIDLANLWINGLEAEGRIEQTTINEYRRVLDNLVLPSVGGLKLREATTGRLDRLLLKLREQSVNRQRKAKVVLGAMLDIAVRHDAIPTNPARGTSRVHRPKQETWALRVEDLVEIRAAVRRWVNADRPGPKATGDMPDIIDLMLATGCRIGEILALRWSDLDLEADLPTLTVSGTIKPETGKGTYRKTTPKTDASRRTIVGVVAGVRVGVEVLRVVGIRIGSGLTKVFCSLK